MRAVADGELARHWPEARSLVPPGFGNEADRFCVLELRAALAAGEEPPDAPGEIADAVSAIRLATTAPLAAGPVLFETLDGRPFGIRPVLPIAATQPPGRADAARLASVAALAGELRYDSALADADTPLAEALDRWELSLFQHEPFRSEQLRAALTAVLGETWAAARDRAARARAGRAGRAAPRAVGARRRRGGVAAAADAVRRTLVETLRAAGRRELLSELDSALLGVQAAAGLAGR